MGNLTSTQQTPQTIQKGKQSLQSSEAQVKAERIQQRVQVIERSVIDANKLLQNGDTVRAKQLFDACIEALHKLQGETRDDVNFNQALQQQIIILTQKSNMCVGNSTQIPITNQRQAPAIPAATQPDQMRSLSQSTLNKPITSTFDLLPEQERKQIYQRLDQKMVKSIEDSIIEKGPGVQWADIQGLKDVKQALVENIVYPQMRPELFQGIREPTKGILLYGPPGNGKTLLAKAVATECKSTFFSISASTLMSKWVGESEQLMRTLFALAQVYSPSIIFIDEIDSMLTKRSSDENEAARRVKTEFLIQLDGVGSGKGRVLVIGATNRPFDLDEAALRRLTRRIFIGLPDREARQGQIMKMLQTVSYKISDQDMVKIMKLSRGYSSADLTAVVKDAAMAPLRNLPKGKSILTVSTNELRPLNLEDFFDAFEKMQPSVSKSTLDEFARWHSETQHIV